LVFKIVVLPHFDTVKPDSGGDSPMFFFTFDGETSQMSAVTDDMLMAVVEKEVIVMKLSASFSAIGQPLDVSVCFREFKRQIKAARFSDKSTPPSEALKLYKRAERRCYRCSLGLFLSSSLGARLVLLCTCSSYRVWLSKTLRTFQGMVVPFQL